MPNSTSRTTKGVLYASILLVFSALACGNSGKTQAAAPDASFPDASFSDAAVSDSLSDMRTGQDGPAVSADSGVESTGPDGSADVTSARDGGADVASGRDGGADVASGRDGAADVGAETEGGGDGGDLCNHPCVARLVGGCVPAGTCVTQGLASCYSNGVKVVNTMPGSGTVILQTTYKDGVECATLEPGYTYRDPSGAVLGTLKITADGTRTITCPGEPTVVIPPGCPSITCVAGTCN